MTHKQMSAPEPKERPIIFSGPMVRAILSGRKTQTRRVVKTNASGRVELHGRQWHLQDPNATLACPYGQPGDRLWVRETWCPRTNGKLLIEDACTPYYKAYDEKQFWRKPAGWSWHPSIHMPRWASRITLDITGVRIERLQNISASDVWAEGWFEIANMPDANCGRIKFHDFGEYWDSINAKRGHPWASNPWVWIIEFKPCS